MVSGVVIAAICAGGYVIFAAVLVRIYPNLFGTNKQKEILKKRFPYSVTKIAHRGGCLIGPENTIFTFRRAIVEGNADMLELDVHQSKDGKIIVSHDGDLDRICGSLIKEKNLSNIEVGKNPNSSLPQLLRRIPLHFKSFHRGSYYEATENIPVNENTRVCLLKEIFDEFPDVPLHIDIKSEGEEFTKSVLKMIEEYGRETKTFVGSSNWFNRKYIYDYFNYRDSMGVESPHEKRQKFRIFAGPIDYAIVQIAYYMGILPFIPLKFDVFSIPLFTKLRKEELNSCFERFISYFLNSPTLWNHLQRRGILVIGWVLNDPEEFEEASKWPVNGIMSDDPIALNAFFKSHDVSKTMNLLE